MDVLYVLRLRNDKWYIGRTSNLERRFEQHMNGDGAKWTSLHKPINIHESRPLVSDEDEDLVTLANENKGDNNAYTDLKEMFEAFERALNK